METEPESSPNNEEFILGWKTPKMQLPSIFNDLLKQNELVDVTLATAEGRLFGAHRLVLSAFSPYFRQLFAQHPTDQKAYGESIEIIKFFFQLLKKNSCFFVQWCWPTFRHQFWKI